MAKPFIKNNSIYFFADNNSGDRKLIKYEIRKPEIGKEDLKI